MSEEHTDCRLALNLNDWIKLVVDLKEVWTQGVFLQHSGDDGDVVTGGPGVIFDGRVAYYLRNNDEVDTLNEMVATVDVSASTEPIAALGFGSFHGSTRPGEICIKLDLQVDREVARDIKSQVLMTPDSRYVFSGEVIRTATPGLCSLFKVLEFSIQRG